MKIFVSLIWISLVVGCAHVSDKYIWLENLDSSESKSWINHANEQSDSYFSKNKYFKDDKKDYESIILADDRLPMLQMQGDWLFETHKDRNRKQGLFRRIKTADYVAGKDNWQPLLDLDELSKKENITWVLNRVQFLKNSSKALLGLSDGGSDAKTWKEFDLETKTFELNNPFNLPASKSGLEWYDQDTVLAEDALTEDSRTDSGYARLVRIWKRGQSFAESKIIFSSSKKDILVQINFDFESKSLVIQNTVTFSTMEVYKVENLTKITKIQIPSDLNDITYFKNYYFTENKKQWEIDGLKLPIGSLIAWPADEIQLSKNNIKIIFTPNQDQFLSHYFVTKNNLHLIVLKNIQTVVESFEFNNSNLIKVDIDVPVGGIIYYSISDSSSNKILWYQSDFLLEQRYVYTEPKHAKKIIKKIAARFDHKPFVVHQYWVESNDGTKIPYFIIHHKNMKLDGNNAVWMNGYGGFEISRLPNYLGAIGKVWLEKNGVYVVANIRGGGEFGPAWHQAAILQNKQKSYDDFIAIAEDLIKRKITSPKKIGIEGGSNGGLLVGAVSMQRPDLFGAVICHVPLLDMLRFHKLHAGASWIAEYGNPDIPEQRAYIEKYSPYQNIKSGINYPEFFFYTSTKDDRVHPGHARKMAAKMIELNQPVVFFEQQQGGHSRSTALLESAELYAKFSSFFKKALKLEN